MVNIFNFPAVPRVFSLQFNTNITILESSFLVNQLGFGYKFFLKLKLTKDQENAKQHPEAELLLFENHSHSLSTLSYNNNKIYSKKQAKEQVCLYLWDYTINHNENEEEKEK